MAAITCERAGISFAISWYYRVFQWSSSPQIYAIFFFMIVLIVYSPAPKIHLAQYFRTHSPGWHSGLQARGLNQVFIHGNRHATQCTCCIRSHQDMALRRDSCRLEHFLPTPVGHCDWRSYWGSKDRPRRVCWAVWLVCSAEPLCPSGHCRCVCVCVCRHCCEYTLCCYYL